MNRWMGRSVGRWVGRLVGGCMAVLMRRRVVDRCVVGCCSWNFCTAALTLMCCYGNDYKIIPFYRTFAYPAPDKWIILGASLENLCCAYLGIPWLCFCLQIPCAVDIVVGPILVNAADCCVTCCCYPNYAESCCCVACAGGLKRFDMLHWSLWNQSPFRRCCFCSHMEEIINKLIFKN